MLIHRKRIHRIYYKEPKGILGSLQKHIYNLCMFVCLHFGCQVLFRLNFLVVVLCVVMDRPYQFYYFVPLVTFWFVIIYGTLAMWPQILQKTANSRCLIITHSIRPALWLIEKKTQTSVSFCEQAAACGILGSWQSYWASCCSSACSHIQRWVKFNTF